MVRYGLAEYLDLKMILCLTLVIPTSKCKLVAEVRQVFADDRRTTCKSSQHYASRALESLWKTYRKTPQLSSSSPYPSQTTPTSPHNAYSISSQNPACQNASGRSSLLKGCMVVLPSDAAQVNTCTHAAVCPCASSSPNSTV